MPIHINSAVPGARGATSPTSRTGTSERRLRVPLGHLVATRATDRLLMSHETGRAFVMSCLRRHERGDWGDLDRHDAEANDLALVTGARILSSYLIPEQIRRDAGDGVGDDRLWIITEAENSGGARSQTTVLFPSDY